MQRLFLGVMLPLELSFEATSIRVPGAVPHQVGKHEKARSPVRVIRARQTSAPLHRSRSLRLGYLRARLYLLGVFPVVSPFPLSPPVSCSLSMSIISLRCGSSRGSPEEESGERHHNARDGNVAREPVSDNCELAEYAFEAGLFVVD